MRHEQLAFTILAVCSLAVVNSCVLTQEFTSMLPITTSKTDTTATETQTLSTITPTTKTVGRPIPEDPPKTIQASDFTYIIKDDNITITGVTRWPFGDVVIPGIIEGKRVVSIGEKAFNGYYDITRITIPSFDNVPRTPMSALVV